MKKRALRLTVLTVSLPLALLFLFSPFLRDFLRAFLLEPLIKSYYVFRWYLGRFPQVFLWTALISLASVFLSRTYWRILPGLDAAPKMESKSPVRPSKGSLQILTSEIRAARHRPFYRRKLVRQLVGVTICMIAAARRISIDKARTEFERETWTENSDVLAFFHPRRRRPGSTSGRDFHNKLGATLSFLEHYLEGG
jgi:hypothetical protein